VTFVVLMTLSGTKLYSRYDLIVVRLINFCVFTPSLAILGTLLIIARRNKDAEQREQATINKSRKKKTEKDTVIISGTIQYIKLY